MTEANYQFRQELDSLLYEWGCGPEAYDDVIEHLEPLAQTRRTKTNEAVYWRQVADSRLATIYQERDAKQRLQSRLDALEAEHAKLTADYEELSKSTLPTALLDYWDQVDEAAKRRRERAERYAQAYYERRQDPEAVFVDSWDRWLSEKDAS